MGRLLMERGLPRCAYLLTGVRRRTDAIAYRPAGSYRSLDEGGWFPVSTK